MRKLLVAMFVALLMVGCGEDIKDGLFTSWYGNGQKQFEGTWKDGKRDGPSTEWYPNGQKNREKTYKDGKQDGPATYWYRNGQKQMETTHKDGKLVTSVKWKPNGEKCPVTNVVNGNGVKVVYKEDGTEDIRLTYKDGKVVDQKYPD